MTVPRVMSTNSKSIECVHPREGLLYPVVQLDGRHGSSMYMMAPRGELAAVAETDKSMLMNVNVPGIMMAQEPKSQAMMEQDINEILSDLRSQITVDYIPGAKWAEAATVRPGDMSKRDTLLVTEAQNATYAIMNMDDYERYIDRILGRVERDTHLPSVAEPVAIGNAAVLRDNRTEKPRIVYPREKVNVQDNWMYLELPSIKLSNSQMKVATRWYTLAKVALDRVLVHMDRILPSEDGQRDKFMYGSIGYMLGAYGGWDAKFDTSIEFTGTNYYDEVMKYLPLPFSESFPNINLGRDSAEMADAYFDLLTFNICFAIALKKIGGGCLLPMHYRASRANVYFVKQEINRVMRPVYNVGGSSNPFMPVGTLKSLQNGMFCPCLVQDSNKEEFSRWDAPVTLDGEKFTQLEVDRGRATILDEPGSTGNLVLKITRDGYVDKFSYIGNNLIRIVTPKIQPSIGAKNVGEFEKALESLISMQDRTVLGDITDLEFLSAYWCASQTMPKYGVMVAAPFLKPQYRTVWRASETVMVNGSDERVAIAGETTGRGEPSKVDKGIASSTVELNPQTTSPSKELNSMGGQDVKVSKDA